MTSCAAVLGKAQHADGIRKHKGCNQTISHSSSLKLYWQETLADCTDTWLHPTHQQTPAEAEVSLKRQHRMCGPAIESGKDPRNSAFTQSCGCCLHRLKAVGLKPSRCGLTIVGKQVAATYPGEQPEGYQGRYLHENVSGLEGRVILNSTFCAYEVPKHCQQPCQREAVRPPQCSFSGALHLNMQ